MERASQLDDDWKVVGAEGRKGAPLRIQGYVGGGYCDVGFGWVPTRGDAGRRMDVKENVVGFCGELRSVGQLRVEVNSIYSFPSKLGLNLTS